MRGATWFILQLGVVVAVLSLPASETSVRRVNADGSELTGAATSQLEVSGTPVKEIDLQGAAGAHPIPLIYAIPQLALLLQLLQLLLDVVYKSPQFAQFAHFGAHHPPPAGLLHPKVGPHAHHVPGPPAGLYGNGLYGVSAATSIGKGRPFGPYKYEDNH